MDSGSTISKDEEEYFDYIFPNIYYNGLVNEAYGLLEEHHSHLFLITSDVSIEEPQSLYKRIQIAINDPEIGSYAPSARDTTHAHMNNLKSSRMRKVLFTDGFCVVMPKDLLEMVCPIDLSVNKIGHGTDLYLGYLAMINGRSAVVDDMVVVDHPRGSGYSIKEARIQRDRWFLTKSKKAQLFHRLASNPLFKNSFGYHAMRLIFCLWSRLKN